jgi:hypothetical protein
VGQKKGPQRRSYQLTGGMKFNQGKEKEREEQNGPLLLFSYKRPQEKGNSI